MTESDLFDKGLRLRREVLGDEYVDANLADTDDFMMAFQRIVTEWAWGYSWSRPGLDRKTRSILTLGMLAALGRTQELGIYVGERSQTVSQSTRSKRSWSTQPSIAVLRQGAKPSLRRAMR